MSAQHTAESHHWYSRDGLPVYEVPYADPRKGMRNATLRDARKLDLVPGFSTISKIIAAPALERWKSQQLLMAALTLPRESDEDEDAFLKRVVKDSEAQGLEARDRGTAIHAAIQGHLEGEQVDPDFRPHCVAVEAELMMLRMDALWQCETSFASKLGYGGKVDVHCPGIVGDFKTKDFDEDSLPRPYPEQAMQLAAYREGLGMPDALCFNLFVSRTVDGLVHLHVWDDEILQNEWQVFQYALGIWQLRNNHA